MPIHRDSRRLFPLPLNDLERKLLDALSTEDGRSQSEVLRRLLIRETLERRLSRDRLLEVLDGKSRP